MENSSTIDYYDANAGDFCASTQGIAFGHIRDKFTRLIPDGGYILDFGCGSGRDTRAFLEAGYQVDAVDGSAEICQYAASFTGHPVRQMLFRELAAVDKYDGIWACASILHVPVEDLPDILARMTNALRSGGIVYVSFKYGAEVAREQGGRLFTDMTEAGLEGLLRKTPFLALVEMWRTHDVRAERNEEWLNIILRKQM